MSNKKITRKHFLELTGGLGAAFALGCTGGDDADTGADAAGSSTGHDDNHDDTAATTPMTDTGTPDTGMVDTGMADTAGTDTGMVDTGMPDTGMADTAADSGTGSDSGTGTTGAAVDCSAPAVTISNPHMHTMTVTLAEVEAGVQTDYEIQGGNASHGHTVTLTEADFTTLASTGEVVVESSLGGMHTHTVTVTCA